MSKNFRRQDSVRHLRLGKKRKKLRKWRKPKGKHSKMRLRRKSYPTMVSIGRKNQISLSGKINGQIPILINNLRDLSKADKNSVVILGKVGAKKKLELLKLAQEKNIKVLNIGGKNETRR